MGVSRQHDSTCSKNAADLASFSSLHAPPGRMERLWRIYSTVALSGMEMLAGNLRERLSTGMQRAGPTVQRTSLHGKASLPHGMMVGMHADKCPMGIGVSTVCLGRMRRTTKMSVITLIFYLTPHTVTESSFYSLTANLQAAQGFGLPSNIQIPCSCK